jgi:hypothetical protein
MMHRLSVATGALLLLAGCGSGSSPAAPATTTTAATAVSPATVPPTTTVPAATTDPTAAPCDGDVTFSHAPVDLDAVEYLTPFGLMTDSHVTPVDHQYFQNFVEPDREIAVYAPGAGRVTSIQHFGAPVTEDPQGIVDDFRIVIEHTCTVSSIFIHIGELIPRLAAFDPGVGNYASVDVPVEAGERIGTFTGNVDYNLVDLAFTTDGLIDPASYAQEPWKIHVPDTFAFFEEPIAQQMADLSLRIVEPRGGRFTYDIDGRLVGNWFREGTNGYGGADPDRYWAGHLAFAYNHIDPTMVMVSIGTFQDRSGQFAVAGNGPDPADVTAGSGPVVYQLVDWDYRVDGERWDRISYAAGIEATPGTEASGIIAVELTGTRELRVEIVPGATPADFTGFGPDAVLYTR